MFERCDHGGGVGVHLLTLKERMAYGISNMPSDSRSTSESAYTRDQEAQKCVIFLSVKCDGPNVFGPKRPNAVLRFREMLMERHALRKVLISCGCSGHRGTLSCGGFDIKENEERLHTYQSRKPL